jgi:hypothetical protein
MVARPIRPNITKAMNRKRTIPPPPAPENLPIIHTAQISLMRFLPKVFASCHAITVAIGSIADIGWHCSRRSEGYCSWWGDRRNEHPLSGLEA